VPSGPPTPGELDAYRDEADRFIAELDEEYYLHFAGLKENLELEPIYDRHQELTKLEWAQSLGESVDGDRRVRELWRFACEGHLGNLTKQHSERVAALETELEAEVDGDKVGYRMLRPTIANTQDRGHAPSAGRLVEDVGELLADLDSRSPGIPTALAGISWGGKIAGVAAAE
jgi:hypothetical protein